MTLHIPPLWHSRFIATASPKVLPLQLCSWKHLWCLSHRCIYPNFNGKWQLIIELRAKNNMFYRQNCMFSLSALVRANPTRPNSLQSRILIVDICITGCHHSLTQWHLRDVCDFQCENFQTYFSYAFPLNMPSCECHKTSLMSQYWFRWWLKAIRQKAITWINVDKALWCFTPYKPQSEWVSIYLWLGNTQRLIWLCQYMYHLIIL